jgi:hypothetical protein
MGKITLLFVCNTLVSSDQPFQQTLDKPRSDFHNTFHRNTIKEIRANLCIVYTSSTLLWAVNCLTTADKRNRRPTLKKEVRTWQPIWYFWDSLSIKLLHFLLLRLGNYNANQETSILSRHIKPVGTFLKISIYFGRFNWKKCITCVVAS